MSSPLLPEAILADALDDVQGPAANGARCRNCGAALHGPFCAQCGQYDAPPDPTLRDLVADAWDALTNLDGKVLTSVKLLLLKPGALTVEYLAGRRARYLAPFRLYLLCSVAFFLLNSIDKPGMDPGPARRGVVGAGPDSAAVGSITAAVDSLSRAGGLTGVDTDSGRRSPSVFERRMERGARRLKDGQSDLKATITAQMPNAMFVLMPLYASLLALLYRSRRLRYPAHLVFALHAHAFLFAVLAIDEIADLLRAMAPAVDQALSYAVIGSLLVYYPVAMRRVYGGRWRTTVARALVIGNMYPMIVLVLTLGVVVGFLYAIGG